MKRLNWLFPVILFFALGIFFSSLQYDARFLIKVADKAKSFMPTKASTASSLTQELIDCEYRNVDEKQFVYSERNNCYSQKLTKMVKEHGMAKTTAAFKQYLGTSEGGKVINRGCHILGHDVGQLAVLNGEEPAEVLGYCSNFCESQEGLTTADILNKSGCFSGVAHAYVIKNGVVEGFEEKCESLDAPEELINYGCYHGAGHGIADYTNYDLEPAIDLCRKFEKEEARYQCGQAAFMEPHRLRIAPLSSVPSDMLSYCQSVEPIFKEHCYEYVGFLNFARTLDFVDSVKVCGQVPQDLGERCAERLGEGVHYTSSWRNADLLVSSCTRVKTNLARACLRGVTTMAADIGNPQGAYGLEICSKVQVAFQKDCYADLAGFIFRRYGEEMRKTYCSQVPEDYRDACLVSNLYTKPEFK